MLRQALAITLLSSPALALDCTVTMACLTDGNCAPELAEGPFALELRPEGLAVIPIEEPGAPPAEASGPPEPQMILAEQPAGSGGTRVFTVVDPNRGDAALLSLTDEQEVTLTVHGLMFGAPYGLMTTGLCSGDPL